MTSIRRIAFGAAVLAALGLSAVSSVDTAVAGKENRPIFATAQASGFTVLTDAIKATKLQKTLNTDGPFTVFAPTDEAFAKLPEGQLEALLNDPETLKKILLYHVVEGTVTSDEVARMSSANTLNGSPIDIKVMNDGVVLNDNVKVTGVDVKASNGVIHVVDTVLLPPNM